jgi:hypothetical protein
MKTSYLLSDNSLGSILYRAVASAWKSITSEDVAIINSTVSNSFNGSNFQVTGEGPVVTRTVELSNFSQLIVSGPINVIISKSKPTVALLEGQKNIIDLIELNIDGERLAVKAIANFTTTQPIRLHLAVSELSVITLHGSGDITTVDAVTAEYFTVVVNGSGDANITVDSNNMNALVGGSGDIVLIGKSNRLSAMVNGSGDIWAKYLIAKEVHATVHGSGDIEVRASEVFNGNVHGSGDIICIGNPKEVRKNINGSGSVEVK